MLTGTVIFFSSEKHYGFVKRDDGGKDLFLHSQALGEANIGTLQAGDKVAFEMRSDGNGRPFASDIRMLK